MIKKHIMGIGLKKKTLKYIESMNCETTTHKFMGSEYNVVEALALCPNILFDVFRFFGVSNFNNWKNRGNGLER